MKNIKSHFTFTRKQRNGIFLLLFIIVALQCFSFFVLPKLLNKASAEDISNPQQLDLFRKEMDSLRFVEAEKRKPKIYPFNPNFITDYKGYTLGMSTAEIDRLLKYRSQDKWINSTKEFQQVTQVSDSLLNIISPFFKFPEWVTNPKPKTPSSFKSTPSSTSPKTFQQKIDLNKATALQLQKVHGIGETFSDRIIKYRNKHQGFIADVELQEVYGLKPEVIDNILKEFTVKSPKQVKTIGLNTASRDELVLIPYIDYEVAHQIIEYRTLREGFQSLEELTKVKDFPIQKIDIIKLYLTLN